MRNDFQKGDNYRKRSSQRFKRKTMEAYGMSLFYILMGIFLLLKPGTALSIFCNILGVAILIIGIIQLIRYFRSSDLLFQSPISGILLIVVGLIFIFSPYLVTGLARFMIAVAVFGSAISQLVEVDTLRAYNDPRWYIPLIAGIISIIFSLIILFYPVENIVVMVIGIALIYSGITGILFHHRAARYIKSAASKVDETIRNVHASASGRPHYDVNGKEIIDVTDTVEESDIDS